MIVGESEVGTANAIAENAAQREILMPIGMHEQAQDTIIEEAVPKLSVDLRREGRLTRIAKALISGASVTEIAEAEGIGRTLASREANSPECRQLVAEFVSDEHNEMRALFYRSLRAIEQALSARREYMTKEGQIIYGGPDHYARLAATKQLRDFLSAGRPAPKQPEKEERKRLTLPELEALLKEDAEAKKQVLNVM
jgi:hypothetical protein